MRRVSFICRMLVVALAIFSASSGASPYNWNGSVSGSWSNPANWTPNGIPQNGDVLVFPTSAVNKTMQNDLPAGRFYAQMQFETAAYVLNGNDYAVTGDVTNNPSINAHVTVQASNLILGGTYRGGVDVGTFGVGVGNQVIGGLSGSGSVFMNFQGKISGSHPAYTGTVTVAANTSVEGAKMPAATVTGGRDGMRLDAGIFSRIVVPSSSGLNNGAVATLRDVEAGELALVDSGVGFDNSGFIRVGVHGTTPGATQGRFRVGKVSLAKAALLVDMSILPGMGQVVTVVDNQGSQPVSGQFKNLPEGATLMVKGIYPFTISYVGGDGNDITLTSTSGAPPAQVTLMTSANPVRATDCVHLLAQVSPVTAGGNVNFYGDGQLLGTVAVSGGKAAFAAPPMANGTVLVAEYRGDTANANGTSNSVVQEVTSAIRRVSTDLNGDGRGDILWHNASTGELHRMLMDAFTITNQATVYREADTAWAVVGDGDFNGDGVADVLWRNAATGQVYLMTMNASGVPAGGQVVWVEGAAAWQVVSTADVDGDGKADLTWWNSTTGQQYVMLMDGFALKQHGLVHTEPDTQWHIVASGKFYGGCSTQLVWRHQQTGRVHLQGIMPQPDGRITYGFDPDVYAVADTQWKVLAAGDLDGDGKADFIYRNSATGQVWGILMDGRTPRGGGPLYDAPLDWTLVATGDYNGDGRSDLLFRNQLDGRVHMALMFGLSVAAQATMYVEGDPAWRIMGPSEYAH